MKLVSQEVTRIKCTQNTIWQSVPLVNVHCQINFHKHCTIICPQFKSFKLIETWLTSWGVVNASSEQQPGQGPIHCCLKMKVCTNIFCGTSSKVLVILTSASSAPATGSSQGGWGNEKGENSCRGVGNGKHVKLVWWTSNTVSHLCHCFCLCLCLCLCHWDGVMVLAMANLWCCCCAVPTLSLVKDEEQREAARCHTGEQEEDNLVHLSLFFLAFSITCLLHHLLTLVGSCLGCLLVFGWFV